MLGHARPAIDDAIHRWPIDADPAAHDVQHGMAGDSDNWNPDALEPMLFCLGLLERIVWNSFRVDSWRLSVELFDQSGRNVPELVVEQHHRSPDRIMLARPGDRNRDDDIHRND